MSDLSIDDVDVRDLPPSCKFVLHVVQEEEEIRRQELLKRTSLPESTIDGAIDSLENRDFLSVDRDPDDLRQVVLKIGSM